MEEFTSSPWILAPLSEICGEKESINPENTPDTSFKYVDISSVCNKTFQIVEPKIILGRDAPSRARKKIRYNDVLLATTRPYLKAITKVSKDFDGQICSTGFCVLRPTEQIDPDWLFYLAISDEFMRQITPKMRGTNYPAVTDKDVLAAKIPIPSISEQRRLVIRIKDCMEQIEEIIYLHKVNIISVSDIKLSLALGEHRGDRDWVEVGELVDWIKETETVSESETYDFVGTKSFGKGLFHSATRTAQDFKYANLRRLRHRDFIYPKLMAWEGAFGMVPKEFDGFVVSPEFVVFRTKDGIICPEVLDTYFRSSICLEDVRNASTGSNKRRRRINPQAFLKLKMPVPPHDVQEQLKKVYEFEAKAAESWKDLPETLEKIRQGILKKAFAGEL